MLSRRDSFPYLSLHTNDTYLSLPTRPTYIIVHVHVHVHMYLPPACARYRTKHMRFIGLHQLTLPPLLASPTIQVQNKTKKKTDRYVSQCGPQRSRTSTSIGPNKYRQIKFKHRLIVPTMRYHAHVASHRYCIRDRRKSSSLLFGQLILASSQSKGPPVFGAVMSGCQLSRPVFRPWPAPIRWNGVQKEVGTWGMGPLFLFA
ncbi:hypothetical protein B0J11DRAFT_540879, partial [Dendryphion nanum]